MKSWQSFLIEFKNILFKPVRQVTHLSLVIVVAIVLLSGIPAPKVSGEEQKTSVDPFGIQRITKATTTAGDKVTAVEAVATIASVFDDKMAEDAFQAADTQAAKSQMAVSGDSIAKLAVVATTSSSKGKASSTKYIVKGGDTLSGIAVQFGITSDSIKWSNGMSDADYVKPGQTLWIPSVTGVIYTVKSGDSIDGIASRYKSQTSMIIAQNDLYGEDIYPGLQIVIPDGVVEEPPPPAPEQPTARVATARSSVPSYVSYSSGGSNRFPWGYCTWWVAHKRNVPWSGNAWQWYGNAIAYGRPVGGTPVPGAIMVTWESGWGHVAYVESVSGGSFTVSEMNYAGYGIVSTRTITTSSVPLIGFIY